MADIEADRLEVERLKSLMLKKSYWVMTREIVDRGALPMLMLKHYQWIIELEKQGAVFGSGPLFAADGSQGVGMTIFRAANADVANELAAGDPFVTGGAARYQIHRWQVNEGRITVSLDFSDQTFTLG